MSLFILVDYDNLERIDKRRGLSYLANRIIATLTQADASSSLQVNIRLYGGWYSYGTITRRAQDLAIEIQGNFPRVISTGNLRLIVNIELAFSLLIAPTEHILNTYRVREFPTDLICDHPSLHGCSDAACPINHVHHFFTYGTCTGQTCNIEPKDIIYRGQQKLVDTTLAVDIIFLTMSNVNPIILVSSDDDFWPSIRTALYLGSKIIHIHTKRGRRTPAHYVQYAGLTYRESQI